MYIFLHIKLAINESATFLEQNVAVNSWAVDKSYGLLRTQLGSDDNWYLIINKKVNFINFFNYFNFFSQWTTFAGYVGAYNVITQYSVCKL